jgi:hypothetical protein
MRAWFEERLNMSFNTDALRRPAASPLTAQVAGYLHVRAQMRFEDLRPLLGSSIRAPACRSALGRLGIDCNSIEMPDDDFRTYVEHTSEGISLVFTDEAPFLGKGDMPIGTGEIFFSGIFLYSEGKEGYSEYAAPLPFGLRFEETSDAARAKLGLPEWHRQVDGRLIADRWTVDDGARLHLTYSPVGTIELLSFQVPDRAL